MENFSLKIVFIENENANVPRACAFAEEIFSVTKRPKRTTSEYVGILAYFLLRILQILFLAGNDCKIEYTLTRDIREVMPFQCLYMYART